MLLHETLTAPSHPVWARVCVPVYSALSPAQAGAILAERRGAYELCREEAAQEDAQAQAPQDAEEDALAAQAQGLAAPR